MQYTETNPKQEENKKITALKVTKIVFAIIFWVLFLLLLVNVIISLVRKDGQINFFGMYMVAIVSDSMSPEFEKGSLIVNKLPPEADELELGDVITYQITENEGTILISHRIIEIQQSGGEYSFRTAGINNPGPDSYLIHYDSVVGVWTGNAVPLLGYVFAFFSSVTGLITLLLVFLVVFVSLFFTDSIDRDMQNSNLKQEVANISHDLLAHLKTKNRDSTDELMELEQALNILAREPESKKDKEELERRLRIFTERYNGNYIESASTSTYVNDNLESDIETEYERDDINDKF
jgi:signal peptidase